MKKPTILPLKGNFLDKDKARRELQNLVKSASLKQDYFSQEGLNRVKKDNWRLTGKKEANYLYLYDSFLQNNEYKIILRNIEKRLNDFEISGKIVRLSSFTNPRVLLEDEMRHGVRNAVIVGNDETFVRILSRAADLPLIFGFLPVGQKKNHFAEVFGLPLNEKACEIIAARKIEKLDYATINEKLFFLCYLYLPSEKMKIEIDNSFTINFNKEKVETAVANLLPPPFENENFTLHPQDGRMELYLRPAKDGLWSRLTSSKKKKKVSIFFFKKLLLRTDRAVTAVADGKETRGNNLLIEVNKNKLALIVGKGRQF